MDYVIVISTRQPFWHPALCHGTSTVKSVLHCLTHMILCSVQHNPLSKATDLLLPVQSSQCSSGWHFWGNCHAFIFIFWELLHFKYFLFSPFLDVQSESGYLSVGLLVAFSFCCYADAPYSTFYSNTLRSTRSQRRDQISSVHSLISTNHGYNTMF